MAAPLKALYPEFAGDKEVMDIISANVSANLLGLGNAATPLGLEAARRMSRRSPGVAGDGLCMLVVCNTASIQLIPTTVAGVRMAEGCRTPFDILPAVWLASAVSLTVGICAAKLFSQGLERLIWNCFFTMLVPMIVASVALYGALVGVDVYDALIHGAKEGLGVLLRIIPALIALLTAVYMLRASGALDLAAGVLEPILTLWAFRHRRCR
jgi:spore maturation protein SpmA